MALILRELYKNYNYALIELSDPRVKEWFLMKSPITIIAIVVLYLCIVLEYGPRFMKDRTPYKIDRLLVWYNALQIFACLYVVIEGIRVGLSKYDFRCTGTDYTDHPDAIYIARIMWFYFIIKVIDLLDTVFFIMRKKENQISFLHVYHHGGMVLLSWLFTKFVAGGMPVYIIVINSFVHIIMYAYYLLTSYDKRYKRSVWWKKHITQLQLFQFGVLLLQHLQILAFQRECGFPKWTLGVLIPQNLTIFALFGDFYYKAYIKSNKAKPKPQ